MIPLPWSDPPQEVELLDIETFQAPRRLTAFDLRAQTGGGPRLSSPFLFDDIEDDQ